MGLFAAIAYMFWTEDNGSPKTPRPQEPVEVADKKKAVKVASSKDKKKRARGNKIE